MKSMKPGLFQVVLLATLYMQACDNVVNESPSRADHNVQQHDSDVNPWPEIRKKRISELLPQALDNAGVDGWLVVCRENNNDPLADHVGGENAGGEAAFLFYNDAAFHSIVFSPEGEATALDELDVHHEVVPVKRGASAIQAAADYILSHAIDSLAINISEDNSVADGLSHSQYQRIADALADRIALVPSTDVVYHWLSIKLPAEVAIMREAARLASDWQYEAYDMITPGETTDADVAKFLKTKMREHGVSDAWAADQNPNVNSGPDRGHSHATDKVIMPGDVIQIDFGVKLHDRWVSDIQRFAYVLRDEETTAPDSVQRYWEAAKNGSRAALAAMKPGVKGIDVDRAQRQEMEKAGSEYVMWSTGHPVGYVAHDVGPNLGGSQSSHVRPAAQKELKAGMTFAYDGFHAWKLDSTRVKTISVEEMVVITPEGAEYLIEPQEDLILVKN